MAKLKVGDKVQIINYGHPIWVYKGEWKRYIEFGMTNKEKPDNIISETTTMWTYDMSPEKVGKIDTVDKVSGKSYSLVKNGAWYDEQQLKLVENG